MSYRVEVSRRPGCTLFDLRGSAGGADTLFKRLRTAVPVRPNTVRVSDARAVYWVGPERWLLCEEHGLPAGSPDMASPALPAGDTMPLNVSVVDVSDAYVRFSVTGPDALDVMSQATPLDLGPGTFPDGSASYTEFFGTTALTECVSAGTSFVVFVERSYADYVEACLRRAAG